MQGRSPKVVELLLTLDVQPLHTTQCSAFNGPILEVIKHSLESSVAVVQKSLETDVTVASLLPGLMPI